MILRLITLVFIFKKSGLEKNHYFFIISCNVNLNNNLFKYGKTFI